MSKLDEARATLDVAREGCLRRINMGLCTGPSDLCRCDDCPLVSTQDARIRVDAADYAAAEVALSSQNTLREAYVLGFRHGREQEQRDEQARRLALLDKMTDTEEVLGAMAPRCARCRSTDHHVSDCPEG